VDEPFRIFIGWDSRQPECADVLACSLVRHASIPLNIRFLKLDELAFSRPHDPLQSTEFTYTRFLVPALSGYEGRALFLDSDMLCLADIRELAELDLSRHALRVVQHDHQPVNTVKMDGRTQTCYPRKNWSSLMLMNCSKLRLWSPEVVQTRSGAYLHRFEDIPDQEIGDIPKGWNVLDERHADTRLIHYTNGGPWFENHRIHPHAAVWFEYRDAMHRVNA